MAEGSSPCFGNVEVELEMVSYRGSKVALRIRRMAATFSADLMLGLHEFLLDPSAALVVGSYRLSVEQLGERRDNLLVDLGKLVRLVRLDVVEARSRGHDGPCWHRLGSRGIGGSIFGRPVRGR
jgi:hypothetical protein